MTSVNLNKSASTNIAGPAILSFLTCGCLRGRKVAPKAEPLPFKIVSVDKWPPQAAKPLTKTVAGQVANQMKPPVAIAEVSNKAAHDAVTAFKNHFVFKALFQLLPAATQRKLEQDVALFYEAAQQKKEGWGARYKALATAVQQAITIATKDHNDLATYFRIALLNSFVTSDFSRSDYMVTIASNNVVVNFANTCADLLLPVPENADGAHHLKTMVAGYEEAAKGLKNFNRELAKKEQLERADSAIEAFVKNCSALTTLLSGVVDEAAAVKQPAQTATKPVKKPKISLQARYNRESTALLARLNK